MSHLTNFLKAFCLTVIVFPFLTVSIKAVNYYVDNSCSVNGNGLSQNCGAGGPFNSLSAAQSAVTGSHGDDFLLLKKGQTFNGQYSVNAYGSGGHPFTISSYGVGLKPVISGGQANISIGCANCSNIVIDGLELTGSTGGIDYGGGVKIGTLYQPVNNITVKNSDIHNASGSYAACVNIYGSSYNTIINNIIHDCVSHGVLLYRINTQNSVIENTFANNEVYNVTGTGIGSTSNVPYTAVADTITKWGRVGRSYIYGNSIHDTKAGIWIGGSSRLINHSSVREKLSKSLPVIVNDEPYINNINNPVVINVSRWVSYREFAVIINYNSDIQNIYTSVAVNIPGFTSRAGNSFS